MSSPSARNPWAAMVLAHLAERGLSDADFCREVDLKTSTFAEMKRRTPRRGRVPDRETVMRWATALGLPAEDRERLWQETILLYAPQSVQELVRELQRGTPPRGSARR